MKGLNKKTSTGWKKLSIFFSLVAPFIAITWHPDRGLCTIPRAVYTGTCHRGFSQMSFVRTKERHRILRYRILFFKLIKAKTTCGRDMYYYTILYPLHRWVLYSFIIIILIIYLYLVYVVHILPIMYKYCHARYR